MLRFLFDLDGTITTEESVIAVVRTLGLDEAIADATRTACAKGQDYRANFGRRVGALKTIPISQVAEIVGDIPLRPLLSQFIHSYAGQCAIVSNNLDCWCLPLARKFECAHFFSRAETMGDVLVGVAEFADKCAVVDRYRQDGFTTVYIGDGANDLQAMQEADHAVAVGFSKYPCEALAAVADFTARNENELIEYLKKLIDEQS